MWVAMAFEPISVSEMIFASMIDYDVDICKAKDFDYERDVSNPSEFELLKTCGSLVEIYDGDKLRFTHRTVREFLVQPLEELSKRSQDNDAVKLCMVDETKAHATIATICGKWCDLLCSTFKIAHILCLIS